jgi:hypothetical protein
MCEPTTIITGLSLALSAGGAYQQVKANNEMAKTQQEQMQAQATEDTFDRMQQMRELRAQARASAAESGTAGLSLDALLSDINFQSGLDSARIGKNMSTAVAASAAENAARNRSAVNQAGTQMLGTAANWADSSAGTKFLSKLKIGS